MMTEEKTVTFEMLTDKIKTSGANYGYDLNKITSAFRFADKAHEGQKRSSGEPYISHPLAVADILLDLGMDTDTICAALLHDVVEDTAATREDLCRLFGDSVANMVEGVTKLTKTQILDSEQRKEETIRKILVAMSHDVRIMIIKLCDRLHNMRTLGYRPAYKQQSTAYETMNVYVPLANRLGIDTIKSELEDLSFYYLDTYAYKEIETQLGIDKEERNQFIENIKKEISERLKNISFQQEPFIEGRVKSIYGIYKKMYRGHKDFDQIYDKYAVRVIVSDADECFTVYGMIQNMYRDFWRRYKNYINRPKPNGYQSIHATVVGREGIPFEVQIRSWEMHRHAEYGIAAHWKYKEGIDHKDKLDRQLAWVHEALSSSNPGEILQMLKTDLSPEEIYVMTPKGNAVFLPFGATPIDFAYRVHTEVGHKMMYAKVDGSIVPLDYEFTESEKVCEIITSRDPNKGPSRSWLDMAKTVRTRAKIRAWFKKERREENIEAGRDLLEKTFKRIHMPIPEKDYEEFFREDMKRYSCDTMEAFYAAIGYGGVSVQKLLPHWREKYQKIYQTAEKSDTPENGLSSDNAPNSKVILEDIKNCVFKFAQCCNPLPGEEIVGFVTRGHGISVHTASCANYIAALKRSQPDELNRWHEIQWSDVKNTTIQTRIEIIATERTGLLADVTAVIAEARVMINRSSSRTLPNGNAMIEMTVSIVNKSQLTALFDRIRKVKSVLSVERAQS